MKSPFLLPQVASVAFGRIRHEVIRVVAKETCRWCANCNTTDARIAVDSGAVGFRAKWTVDAEAREPGAAILMTRAGFSVEFEIEISVSLVSHVAG